MLVIDCCPQCGGPGVREFLHQMMCPHCFTRWAPAFPRLVVDLRPCGCHRDPAVFGHWHPDVR